MRVLCFLFVFLFLISAPAFAWDGYDYEAGNYVEIDKGNLVREGETVEVYDYNTGNYHDVEVQSIDDGYGSVELEVYDYDSGEYRTLEMDRD